MSCAMNLRFRGLSSPRESSNIRAGNRIKFQARYLNGSGVATIKRFNGHVGLSKLFIQPLALLTLTLVLNNAAFAEINPYLARPGERPITIRIATCAVSGGFAHLYTALENNLFDKYGFKMEHVFIRGSGPALAALIADESRISLLRSRCDIAVACGRHRR